MRLLWRKAALVPDRSDLIARLKALPELPEAERMRTQPMQRPTLKTIADWKRRWAC